MRLRLAFFLRGEWYSLSLLREMLLLLEQIVFRHDQHHDDVEYDSREGRREEGQKDVSNTHYGSINVEVFGQSSAYTCNFTISG